MLPSGEQQGQKESGLRRGIPTKGSTSTRQRAKSVREWCRWGTLGGQVRNCTNGGNYVGERKQTSHGGANRAEDKEGAGGRGGRVKWGREYQREKSTGDGEHWEGADKSPRERRWEEISYVVREMKKGDKSKNRKQGEQREGRESFCLISQLCFFCWSLIRQKNPLSNIKQLSTTHTVSGYSI